MDHPRETADVRAQGNVVAKATIADHEVVQTGITRAEDFAEGGPIVIPIVAESLTIGREEHETGRVRIIKSIAEHQENLTLPTYFTEAEITRVPVDRLVEGVAPRVEQRGDILIVPVLEEVLVTEKRLRLKEEIHIAMRRREDAHTEQVTLRREVVSVQRESTSGGSGAVASSEKTASNPVSGPPVTAAFQDIP